MSALCPNTNNIIQCGQCGYPLLRTLVDSSSSTATSFGCYWETTRWWIRMKKIHQDTVIPYKWKCQCIAAWELSWSFLGKDVWYWNAMTSHESWPMFLFWCGNGLLLSPKHIGRVRCKHTKDDLLSGWSRWGPCYELPPCSHAIHPYNLIDTHRDFSIKLSSRFTISPIFFSFLGSNKPCWLCSLVSSYGSMIPFENGGISYQGFLHAATLEPAWAETWNRLATVLASFVGGCSTFATALLVGCLS